MVTRGSLVALALLAACRSPAAPATLVGRATLPAATLAAGPPSGAQLGDAPIHGHRPPFASQPVQGFSALVAAGDDTYLALVDNGYGTIERSADFHLRVYTLRIDPRTASGGAGAVEVIGHVELRDPDRRIAFPIVQQFSAARVLTGADLDPESMQRAPDGTLWFGDEFGPFLLHTSADGVVLEPPIPLPDLDRPGGELRAPQHPDNEEAAALRLVQAVRWRGARYGATRAPVVSPHHAMVVDDDPATGARELFDVRSLRAAGLPVVVWTVNDVARMHALMRLGVDGIISDRPDLLLAAARSFDGDGDGAPDLVDADGLVVPGRFDLQGHRGARDLRPENTLPAMEAALDNLVTTLETDVVLTADEVPLVGHDPQIDRRKCHDRERGEAPLEVRAATAAALQRRLVCDGLVRGLEQTAERALSPVALAFAAAEGLADPYTPPTLAQLLRFVDAYAAHHEGGAGATHPEARRRAANARRVRLSVETKLSPDDADARAAVFADRVIAAIAAADLQARVDVQSFDFRALLRVQARAPAIRVVFLFADGVNLRGGATGESAWLAGLAWPHGRSQPPAVASSGGFEGMALRAEPPALLPMLEQPAAGAPVRELWIHEYDLSQGTYTDRRWRHVLDPRATAVGDLQIDGAGRGFVIERDDSEGSLGGYKALRELDFGAPGAVVAATTRADLLAIADPHGLAPAVAGDVGTGGGRFALPFVTLEALVLLPGDRVLVANDNNFPFSVGRHRGDMRPDDSEFVLLQLPPL